MKRHFTILISISLLATLAIKSPAQPGSLDITFNPGTGVNATTSPGLWAIALQPNGKVLVAGYFTKVNNTNRMAIARLNADGSLDTAFDPGDGIVGGNLISSLALQADGRIVIGGTFSQVNSLPRNGIARLRADGSLDTSFDPGASTVSPQVYSVALQPNGQVLAGGNFGHVARLNTNGSPDSTFNSGSFNSTVWCIAVQTNGQVLVGGYFTTVNGTNRNYVARLNSDGSLDGSFNPAPIVGSLVQSIIVQTNGQILIGGTFSTVNGYSRRNIARLNADGTLDPTFNPAITANGLTTFEVPSMALQPDGKVLAGCGRQTVNGVQNVFLVRLSGNGSLDATFGPVVAPQGLCWAMAIQPDGKVLVGGYFTSVNGTNINRIARLNGDASPPASLQFLAANQYFGTYLAGTISNIYRVEWTTNVNTPALWTPLFNVTMQTNPQFILDPNPISGQKRFYRAVTLP